MTNTYTHKGQRTIFENDEANKEYLDELLPEYDKLHQESQKKLIKAMAVYNVGK